MHLLKLCLILEEPWHVNENVDQLILKILVRCTIFCPGLIQPEWLLEERSALGDQSDSDLLALAQLFEAHGKDFLPMSPDMTQRRYAVYYW